MMFNIVEAYMNKLTKEDVNSFATKKGANLSPEELDFTYNFIMKNWKDIFKNPNLFDINRYQNKYTPQNFTKVKQVFNEYYQKFGSFLK